MDAETISPNRVYPEVWLEGQRKIAIMYYTKDCIFHVIALDYLFVVHLRRMNKANTFFQARSTLHLTGPQSLLYNFTVNIVTFSFADHFLIVCSLTFDYKLK